jgi:hypothetical protein
MNSSLPVALLIRVCTLVNQDCRFDSLDSIAMGHILPSPVRAGVGMPAVTDNRLKGNYGTALVMSRLSGECLVRPVAVDTDGVDLYCETVAERGPGPAERRPFLHFWLQVKTGDQCRLDSSGKASCSLKLDHLDYYREQPVPVFAALVPTTEWPVRTEPDICVVDITTQILFENFPRDQEYVSLRPDHHWPARDRDSVQAFLAHTVPDTTARLQVSKGVIANSPTPTQQYLRPYPHVPVPRFKDTIRNQLRRTAAFSLLFLLESTEPITTEDTQFRRLLARIVEQFGNDAHWENSMPRAVSSHADGDYSNAVAMYDKALQSIQNDEIARAELSLEERVQQIETVKELVRRQVPLSRGFMSQYHAS